LVKGDPNTEIAGYYVSLRNYAHATGPVGARDVLALCWRTVQGARAEVSTEVRKRNLAPLAFKIERLLATDDMRP
jgi:hypothetical protein